MDQLTDHEDYPCGLSVALRVSLHGVNVKNNKPPEVILVSFSLMIFYHIFRHVLITNWPTIERLFLTFLPEENKINFPLYTALVCQSLSSSILRLPCPTLVHRLSHFPLIVNRAAGSDLRTVPCWITSVMVCISSSSSNSINLMIPSCAFCPS